MIILQIHNQYQQAGGEDAVVKAEKQLLENNGHSVLQLIVDNHSISNLYSKRKDFYHHLNLILNNNIIDVAHIHNTFHIIGSRLYGLLKRKKIPIVQTLHNYRMLCPNGLFFDNNDQTCELCRDGNFLFCVQKKCYQNSFFKSALMLYWVKKWKKAVLKNTNVFIALSEFSKQKFEIYSDVDKKIIVKPNFVPFVNNPELPQYQGYALYIGRIAAEKDIKTILDAAKQLKLPLKIAGTGDQLSFLQKKYQYEDNIDFLGYISGAEKEDIIKKCSFIIFSSLCYENFPISLLEAFRYKKAVVASNLGSIPYIIQNNQNGILFEPKNINSLITSLQVMLENQNYQKLGENAYKIYTELYTEKQNYSQLIEIYKQAIDSNK